MLKRILFALLTVAFFCSYSVTYTSVSDECPYIRFSGTTLKDIVVDKSHIKLEQTNTSVIVTFLNGGAQTITWSSAQARSYGYSLDSLYDYVLDILKVQCDTSGGGGDSTLQTLSISGDTLSISDGNSVILPVFVDIDSAVITEYTVLNSLNTPPGSPSTGDTYLVGNSPTGVWVGHEKDIAEWNGSSWDFTDGVQGDYLYNATNALTYIFRAGNWVQTTGIPALNNGNNISNGLKIGTNNNRSLTFETNNVNRGRIDSSGNWYFYNLPSSTSADTFLNVTNIAGKVSKTTKQNFLSTVYRPIFKGLKIVDTSRYFQADDAFYLLYMITDSITLTMPDSLTFAEGDIIGVRSFFNNSKITTAEAPNLYLYSDTQSGAIGQGEVFIMQCVTFEGNLTMMLLSGLKTDISDSKLKTITRYNYEH